MERITNSAEHHFLTMIETVKETPQAWQVIHFDMSKSFVHEKIIDNIKNINDHLKKKIRACHNFFEDVHQAYVSCENSYLYKFGDNDVLALIRIESLDKKKSLYAIFEKLSAAMPTGCHAAIIDIQKSVRPLQKLSKDKFLSQKRFEAYKLMGDKNKVISIGVRRKNRENPKVLLAEDDRFTANYAASILSNEYDLILAKNGEEAISAYIDHAPDICFLDIHLPGITGHQTLSAIRAIDPNAFVVMLSVDTVQNNIIQASQIGARSFLKKPFSKERLLNTVKTSPYIRETIITNEGERLH